ncbi:MAG: hypothetical protein LH467_12215 [Gemmatimonadaceae bacterium]|nr:hypothetical protein [Gemmatimonadaceae bacterium]
MMPRGLGWVSRRAVVLVVMGGCASVPRVPSARYENAGEAYARLRDSIDLVRSLKPDEVVAAPRIRLVIPSATLATSQYVNAAFHLSADAYVLVVAVDQDRRVRVLYPESPEQSGFAAQRTVHRLPSFFAGFGLARPASRFDEINATQRISPIVGVGVMLAVASDRPLQLDRVLDEAGEWDEQSLQRLVYDQSLAGAAHALGGAMVLTGQDYNVDYSTFGGSRVLNGYGTLASRGFNACGYGYGFDSFGTYASASPTRLVGVYVRNGVRIARYASSGSCGDVSYYDVTVGPTGLTPRDTARRDSTVKQMRPPQAGGVPRNPTAPPALTRGLEPSDMQAGVHDRPIVAAGVRFRRPEQMPAPGVRPLDREPASPERDDMSMRRRPHGEEQSTRPLAPPSGDQDVMRSAPVQREPARSEPLRSEPVRSEPVRAEPVQREPTPVIPPPLG